MLRHNRYKIIFKQGMIKNYRDNLYSFLILDLKIEMKMSGHLRNLYKKVMRSCLNRVERVTILDIFISALLTIFDHHIFMKQQYASAARSILNIPNSVYFVNENSF